LDEKGTPIDRRDAREALPRLQAGGRTLLEPVVKSHGGQFHGLLNRRTAAIICGRPA
jgi:hypothetical protein